VPLQRASLYNARTVLFVRSRSEFEVRGEIRHGSRRGKTFADLDSAWGQGIINSDQWVQIVYLTL
jgi:hypothetical protein